MQYLFRPAQEWCKDGNTRSGYCWIPYSLQLNDDASTSCFPLDKDRSGQWKVGAAAVVGLFTRRKLRTKKKAKGETGVSGDGTQMV
ncbi:hypothetical protein TrVE_jg770 [Triparma verrucosa]|uniref:Uncharacterized protein n=1 Tax=Triparma verrucosa TaxID=1606542 RepID=A0A9W7FC19_9STRA|nr:hypothetical protein TrVE_jg770 [Triparma verrucosa]